jgi:glycerol-1-phosphate dehydrogenase [NAD(P)+]
MKRFGEMSLEELIVPGRSSCACGREHRVGLKYVKIGRDAVRYLPDAVKALGCYKPFVVCDRHTRAAAMEKVETALKTAGIPYVVYEFAQDRVEPDERAVGSLCMALEPDCDMILAVGSGVINDCCKVLAHAARLPQAVVGTAPSMDGYASNSSSMIRDRVKVTLYNACPDAIIADTMIMKDAPERMLQAGLGDMLAKYIALCEWRISHIVTGEYYCEEVAGLMRNSLAKIVSAAPRLLERDPEVIGAVAEGLILSGVAMAFAQVSRPASGLEHYFSHLWEMFALDRGLPLELHGIQVGVGTVLCLKIYDHLRTLTPSRETAEAAMRAFSPAQWEQTVRRVFGQAAQTLIDSENNDWHKNDPARHSERLEKILSHWDEITVIMAEELPDTASILSLMRSLRMPMRPDEIGEDEQDTRDAFLCSRDIRDKYLTSSLLWDLGLLESFPLDTRG